MPTIKVKDKGVWKSIGSAGGGLGAQPNWNQNDPTKEDYIKNRTHYIEDPKEVTVASGIAGDYPQREFSTPIELEEGKLYTVTVNGVECELTAQYENNMNITYLGNPSYLGGPDNGSNTPFLIAFNTFYAPYGLYNISISALIDDVQTTLINETIEFYWDRLFDGILEAGHEYKVIFDGIEYNFTATENADGSAIIIGDMTQDPFDIQYTDDSLILYSLIPGIHTISMMDMTSESEIIEYQNIGLVVSSQNQTPRYEIKEGQTYSVQFGDNTYSCVAKKYYDFIYLGNPVYAYLDGGPLEPDIQSTGEPFIYVYWTEDKEGFIISDNNSINNFSITTMESEIHALDPKFLPEGMGYIETVNSIILPEGRFDGFAVMQEPLYAISIPFEFEPIIDGKYTVRWDGVDYTVPGVSVSGVFCLGNTNYADMLPGGDIPFAIISPPTSEGVYFVTESTAESHTVAISGPVKVAHKMDKDCLPEDAVTSVNGMTGDVQIDSIGAEGWGNYAEVFNDGYPSYASGNYSHAEGYRTRSSGTYSHAEGGNTTASGDCSHAEGDYTTASGNCSHAEGSNARAFGYCSHAEGKATTASGDYSHAEGYYTDADGDYSHVQGTYNIIDSDGRYAHIVGNGKRDTNTNETVLSNAHTLDWEGNAWFQGDVFVGGTSQDDADRLVKLSEIGNIGGGGSSVQPDWNQSDETAPDYVQNKTHYSTPIENPEVVTLTYNQGDYIPSENRVDLELKPFGNVTLIKLSDNTPKYKKYFLNQELTATSGEQSQSIILSQNILDTTSVEAREIEGYEYGSGYVLYTPMIWIVLEELNINGHILSEGVWVFTHSEMYISSISYAINEEIVQLDEKYIPDTIARYASVASIREQVEYLNEHMIDSRDFSDNMSYVYTPRTSSDYNVNDVDGYGYIANRTHYDTRIVDVFSHLAGNTNDFKEEFEKYKISSNTYMRHVSNLTPDKNLVIGGSVSQAGNTPRVYTIEASDITDLVCEGENEIAYSIKNSIYIILSDSATIGGITYKKGIYFPWSMSRVHHTYVSATLTHTSYIGSGVYRLLYTGTEGEIKQLDEKYIPSTIARTSQLDFFTYGTEDLIAGESELATGKLYFVYE